ncbi:WD40 repeat-like protein [Clavulina sp. PMI_390]|nr:WD40 repeat-like protein [Clavulina sp. PMI_390]
MDSLVAPEGVYTMNEELKPPAPHANLPSTQPIYPTRLSTVIINFPHAKSSGPGFGALLGGTMKPKDGDKQAPKKHASNGYDDSLSSSDREEDDPPESEATHPTSTPAGLFSEGSDAINKRKSVRRPKHNIRTTSSSFVTRLQTMENLNRHLSSKTGEVTFMFYNAAKSFFWTEVNSKVKDSLARITFSAHPTCHSINYATANHTTIDVVIGFNTGDLIWFDAISSRYVRINKGGTISSSPCTAIHWVPSSRSLFIVAHADGTIIVYDREREDCTFVPRDPGVNPISLASSIPNAPNGMIPNLADPSHNPNLGSTAAPGGAGAALGSNGTPSSPTHSSETFEWHPLEEMLVTPGPSGLVSTGKEKTLKNPISHWRLSRKPINAFSFAPNCRHVAVASDDGYLRVIDALSERLEDTYSAYFGSLTCVTWSPDGRFILAGGQDDLLTIFAPFEQRVVARCQGHSSFISGIAFDDLKCNGRTYRFASVGEDNKLILWDFSGGALHRPKMPGHAPRLSVSSTISLALRQRAVSSDLLSVHSPPATSPPPPGSSTFSQQPNLQSAPSTRVHPAPSRNEVAVVQPVVTKVVEGDLLASVQYTPAGVFTISRAGLMKYWVRPLPISNRSGKPHKAGKVLGGAAVAGMGTGVGTGLGLGGGDTAHVLTS